MKLILASAGWCIPCQTVKARIKAKNLLDKVEIKDADVDTDVDFFKKYNIKSVPKLLVMEGDEVVEIITGADEIINRITQDHG